MTIRTSIGRCLGIIAIMALGVSAIRDPFSVGALLFVNAVIGLLFFATIRAAWSSRRDGAGWLGFAVFGWSILICHRIGGYWGHWPSRLVTRASGAIGKGPSIFDRLWPDYTTAQEGWVIIEVWSALVLGTIGAIMLSAVASRTGNVAVVPDDGIDHMKRG